MKFFLVPLAVLVAVMPLRATDYYWDANGAAAGVGGTGTWDNVSPLWRIGSSTGTLTPWPSIGGNNDAFLISTAGTLTLANTISVNDIFLQVSTGSYIINGAQTLYLNGTAASVIDIDFSRTLTISSNLDGNSGYTKQDLGNLLLDHSFSNLTGDIRITAGGIQVLAAGVASGLRANAVDLAGGTNLDTSSAGNKDLRVGSISGAGSINLTIGGSGGVLHQVALENAMSSARIVTGATGGYQMRGGNGTTQPLNGNLTGMLGTLSVNSGATVRVEGTGPVNGVIGSGTSGSYLINPRGGSIVLDNSAGNAGSTYGRIGDNVGVNIQGGTLSLIGEGGGTTENVGRIILNDGAATIRVESVGGGATLFFNDSNSLRDSTAMTVDFVGVGGTLGGGGSNPSIQFAGPIFTNSSSGMLANAASPTTNTTGWAVVNGTTWAGYVGSDIVALPDTVRNSGTLPGAVSWELTDFQPSAPLTALPATLGAPTTPLGAFKITPTAPGQVLNLNSFNIYSTALMLTGPDDFSIITRGGGFSNNNSALYVWVTDPKATLNYMPNFGGIHSGPLTKSGPGFFALTGGTNQLAFSNTTNINLAQGVFRGTTVNLGSNPGDPFGSSPTAGAFTTINFRGGTLEVSDGGTFQRGLAPAGTAAGGAINWGNLLTGVTNQSGDGGFSAIHRDVDFTIVTAPGAAASANLVWNQNGFVSDGYALLFGSTQSDSIANLTNRLALDSAAVAATPNGYFAREIRVTGNSNPSITTDAGRLSGEISGSANADLLKTGDGLLQLTAQKNTYFGNTIVHQGTLQIGAGPTAMGTGQGDGNLTNTGKIIINNHGTLLLGGDPTNQNRIRDEAAVVLDGGTFNTDGYSEFTGSLGSVKPGLGVLTLSQNSTIDLGDAAALGAANTILAFSGSADEQWLGTLSIYNYTGTPVTGGGIDQLYFGTSTAGLTTTQLSQISFYSGTLPGTFLGTGVWATPLNGEVTYNAIPEPGTIFAGCALLGLVGWRERRRLKGARWCIAWGPIDFTAGRKSA